MIFTTSVSLYLDTKTNKIIILGPQGKRIVLYPGGKEGDAWVDVLKNDRPLTPLSTAKQVCKFLVRELIERKHIKKIVKDV